MNRVPIVVFGAWYHGEVVAETIAELGWKLAGFVDPDPPADRKSLSSLPGNAAFHVAIGDNQLRADVTRKLRLNSRPLVSIIHPSARVSPSARLGEGVFIAENAVVRTGVIAGDGLLLQAGAVVSHHCALGDFVSIGPNAAAGSHARIGDQAAIGVGANIKPWIRVGTNSLTGAGAAVLRDVPDGATVVGNPARRCSARGRNDSRQSDWKNHSFW